MFDTYTDVNEWIAKVVRPPALNPHQCISCKAELCGYLDAYYGKDPYAARQCTKCRTQVTAR